MAPPSESPPTRSQAMSPRLENDGLVALGAPDPESAPPADQPPPPQAPSPAEEREAKKAAILRSKISNLEAQVASMQSQLSATASKLKEPNASQTVQRHIKLLHTYNEIRDVGQGLLGMVAENRGVRIRDVYGEFGVGEGD